MRFFEKNNKNPGLKDESARAAGTSAPHSRHEFFKHPCRNFDAVVFVHGFRGHFRKTWNHFPDLLDRDPKLPSFDILLLGYSTGYRPFRPSIRRIGRGLVSDIRVLIPNAARVVVVSHSMGGIAALSGVRDAMADGQAQGNPVRRIDRFVLFGTPLKGTHLATFAKLFGFGVLYYTRCLNAQLRELANGQFGQDFESDVTNHVYRPLQDSDYDRRIPIHVCLGEKDWVVDRREARSVILDPPFDSLEEGHFGIKDPTSRDDKRYKVLAHKLQIVASNWFHSLVPRAIRRNTREGEQATHEIWARAEFALDHRLRLLFSGFDSFAAADRDTLREDLLILSVEHAAAEPALTFETALDAGASALSFKMRRRR